MRIGGLAVALSATLALCATGVAAQEAAVPRASVGLFAGEAAGVAGQVWFHQWLRGDLSGGTLTTTSFDWVSAAVIVRLGGTPRRFVGTRVGYQFEYNGYDPGLWVGSRTASALDAGLVARIESLRGSALEAQVGVEGVFRSTPALCCDDGLLPKTSTGVRVAVMGELAVWNQLALFGLAELRTGGHVMQTQWLPIAAAGIRYRF